MAEYAIGKYFLERGGTQEALPYLERAASKYTWARFYLGLMYLYKLDDYDKGMEHLRLASEQGFEPAASAIRNINAGYNAKIVTGVFNLFYYASRIIDEDSEDMYPHPAFADVDMRAKKEDRAKRMGLTMGGM
jgi:TPR repeat protein